MKSILRRISFCLCLILCTCLLCALGFVGCTAPKSDDTPQQPEDPTPDPDPEPVPEPDPEPTPEPDPEPAKKSLNNLFDLNTADIGWVNARGETFPDGSFRTCQAISVEPGDEVLFGAAVTTQGWHMVAYDED